MQKFILVVGAVSCALTVAIGAFGAHALKSLLEANQRVETFNTAVQYQMFHSLALLIIGILMLNYPQKLLSYAGWSHIAGVLLFSGSLYMLCLSGNTKWGAVTPIGGVFFIVGWILLMMAVIKQP